MSKVYFVITTFSFIIPNNTSLYETSLGFFSVFLILRSKITKATTRSCYMRRCSLFILVYMVYMLTSLQVHELKFPANDVRTDHQHRHCWFRYLIAVARSHPTATLLKSHKRDKSLSLLVLKHHGTINSLGRAHSQTPIPTSNPLILPAQCQYKRRFRIQLTLTLEITTFAAAPSRHTILAAQRRHAREEERAWGLQDPQNNADRSVPVP